VSTTPAAPDTVDFGRRMRRAAEALEYLTLSLPIGLVCALTTVALLLGAALSAIWIGLPLVLGAVALCSRLAELERRQANRLLDAHIPPLPAPRQHEGTPWRRALSALTDREGWRVLAFTAIKLPLSLLALAAGLLPVALTAWLLVFGIRGIGHLGDRFYLGPWTLGPLTGLLLLALAVAGGIVGVAALEGMRSLLASLARTFIAPAEQAPGPVREMLAESLGDRTLSVAYWLPERQIFVDESGHAVELPEPGSGRAWTAVERDGRRVAAIIHDAELATGPELVNAAAAGAALAIDNERLKANLRARVEELRVSRVRIVEAADSARRRIERDLHDGAQQQLVSLSLDLRLLKAKLNGNEEAASTVDALSEKLNTALAELRELARGIHPVILTERGLVPAVAALAQRAPVPVEANISIHERLTPAIESAAYFVVAEALTNVAKYAQARNVLVDLRRAGGEVTVVVEDDGVGGADIDHGTGLRGLIDRLSALDGTLELETPDGGGTRLVARIPCEAGDLVSEAMDDKNDADDDDDDEQQAAPAPSEVRG
jgi:signal transduction histidine kinase